MLSTFEELSTLRETQKQCRRGFTESIAELVGIIECRDSTISNYEKIIRARDRFGCWLCAKHEDAHLDEDYSEEKELLRQENLQLRTRLRDVTPKTTVSESLLQSAMRRQSSPRTRQFASGASMADSSPARRSPLGAGKRVTMNAPISPPVRKSSGSAVRPILLNTAVTNGVARKSRTKQPVFSKGGVTYARKLKVLLSHPMFSSMQQANSTELIANGIQIQLNHNDSIMHTIWPNDGAFIVLDGVVRIDGPEPKTFAVGEVYNPELLMLGDVQQSGQEQHTPVHVTSHTVHGEILLISPQLFQKCVIAESDNFVKTNIEQYLYSIKSKLNLTDLVIGRTIGRGGTAVVKLAQVKTAGSEMYALKVIKKSLLHGGTKGDLLKNEKLILECLNDSDFVIKLKQTFKDANNIYIMLELAPGGDLLSVVSSLGILTRAQTQFYLGCMILGIEYCHTKRIIYRDLKVENFLVDSLGYLKLADFGIAKKLDTTDTNTFSLVGTPQFMAPEIILARGYAFAVDFWSLGCCMYELLVGELLFESSEESSSDSQFKLFERILKFDPQTDLNFPDFVDQPSRDLITALLQKNPAHRPSIAEIKAHAFFEPLNDANLLPFNWIMLETRQLQPPFIPQIAPIKRISDAAASEIGTEEIPSASPALSAVSCNSIDRGSFAGYRESAGSWDFNL